MLSMLEHVHMKKKKVDGIFVTSRSLNSQVS